MAKRIPIGRAILFFGGTVVLPAVAIFYHALSEGWGAYVASILDPEALADRIAIIDHGRILRIERPAAALA
jgi:sulfate/thiosulfate transport system permease protein